MEVERDRQDVVMDWVWERSIRKGSRMTSGLLPYMCRSMVASFLKKGKALEDIDKPELEGGVDESSGWMAMAALGAEEITQSDGME